MSYNNKEFHKDKFIEMVEKESEHKFKDIWEELDHKLPWKKGKKA